MARCVYSHCYNDAEYFDLMDDPICEECMIREIDEGADPDDFESM